MNEQKKSSKSKVSWVIALLVALVMLAGGGWWLWGKGLKREVGVEEQAVKREAPPPKVSEAMPAPGGDEERLAEMEKGEVESEEVALAQEEAKKLPGMITYKKRVIREFKWNEGVDSLHWTNVDGGSWGPIGLLANKQGYIYIFDLYDNCKIISPNGELVKIANYNTGEPLGIDGNGNVISTGGVYDSDLNLIKRFRLPAVLPEYRSSSYISEDGKLYIINRELDKRDNKHYIYYIYRCEPYSNDLRIDEKLMKYNPGKAPTMVIPCDIIDPDEAPQYAQLAKQFMEGNINKNVNSNGIYSFTLDDVIYHIYFNSDLKISLGELLAMGKQGNLYVTYHQFLFYSKSSLSDSYNLAITNRDGLIGNITLCESPHFTWPGGISTYIYVEQYSGKVYQICEKEEEENPVLIVWEGIKEEKK